MAIWKSNLRLPEDIDSLWLTTATIFQGCVAMMGCMGAGLVNGALYN